MLVEFNKVRQEPGAGRRRWFDGGDYSLMVWYRPDGALTGFQVVYRAGFEEHALTWREGEGFRHSRVDSGTASPLKNLTPILLPNGAIPWARMREEFEQQSVNLDPDLRAWVRGRLEARA
ncbi:MAG TPA: hypothetical protein VHD61_00890 [Lacunisphaera sp.]|nr:hypothetical protein [Lacunisphaera sp.]